MIFKKYLFCLDYMRTPRDGAGYPPQSGYAELDTTLMPPRAAATAAAMEQYRNTPSPVTSAAAAAGNHPGYAG